MRGSKVRRQLDLAIGSPILWLIGHARGSRANLPQNPKTVILMRTAAIGDTILLGAVTPGIRARFPDARIVLVASQSNFKIAKMLPGIDDVVQIDPLRPLRSLRVIRGLHPDIAIDFGPWPRIDAILTVMSGAKFTAGFRTPSQHRHFAYSKWTQHRNDRHEIENLAAVAEIVGAQAQSYPSLKVPPAKGRERHVVFHAWAGGFRGESRLWPTAYWCQLAAWIAERGHPVILSSSNADLQSARELEAAIRASGVTEVHIQSGSLAELADTLSTAALTVSVNTGIMHLSAALGTPTIALNGPTSTKRWGPVGPQVRSVEPRQGDHGFLNLGFEYPPDFQDCMQFISVADVQAACESLLELCPATKG